METRYLRLLAVGVLLLGLLAGCATTAGREDLGGLPRADHPDYLVHPLRMISLGVAFAGNVVQYAAVEPFYFLLSTAPEATGLSLEERRYIEQRKDAWRQYLAGERRLVQ
jgi:hypothetical protein